MKYMLRDKPAQIFNLDKMGIPLQLPPLKGVCEKGSKNPYCITSGNKSQITVLGCVGPAGHCIPPMIAFNRTRMHPDSRFSQR